jgi:carboxypeptidase Taq
MFSVIHEGGHALYELNVRDDLQFTCLYGGVTMGVHESQSRFYENLIARSRAFCAPLLKIMREVFPEQMQGVTEEELYSAINLSKPSLIRTEADELTYPLHIIVRYEIEQLLLAGEATAREVPKLWAERYQKYIGANVTSDSLGALQDVHWAQGAFGYFPTYALGNAYAAQFRAKMIDEGMDWKGLLAAGNLAPIREWLHDRVWRHGRSKDPAAIIEQATGEPFNPRHYANYLTSKYTTIYGIK